MFQRGQRRRAGSTVLAGDQHHIGMGFRDAGRDGANPDLGDELDVDAGGVVRVLQIVDELREVLDRVDVVVRRRGDQPDAGRRVARPRDPGIDLRSGELTAFARLGTLRHLDLDVVGGHEIGARDAEAPRGHLLDRRAARVPIRVRGEPARVLAALPRVRLATEPVHRDGQRLVRFGRDRAVRHRAGGEATHDRLHGLDLLDRDRAQRGASPSPTRKSQRRPRSVARRSD